MIWDYFHPRSSHSGAFSMPIESELALTIVLSHFRTENRVLSSSQGQAFPENALDCVDSRDSQSVANQIQTAFAEAVMGILDRLILTDAQWSRISQHIIGDERTRGSSGSNNRMFAEGVLWIVQTGAPWRDLLEAFGSWNSAFRRFSRWSVKNVWHCIFVAMADDPDFEYLILDSTIVRTEMEPPLGYI
jgi:putative transposase